MRQTPDPCARRGRRLAFRHAGSPAGSQDPVPGALNGTGQISYLSWPRSPGHDSRSAISSAFPVLPRAKPRSSSAPTAAATSCPVGSPHHSRTLCPCISPYPSTERETKLMLRRRDSPAGSRSNHGSWRRDTWPGPLRSGPRIRALLDGRTSRWAGPRRSCAWSTPLGRGVGLCANQRVRTSRQ